MLSSKRLLLPLTLACATLLCPSLAPAQNADSQQPNLTSTNQVVRRWRLKYFCRPETSCPVESPSFDEVDERLKQKGLLPLIERPYDQSKVDLLKCEIKEIYKENGVAVRLESYLRPSSSPGTVEVVIEVHKLYEIRETRPLSRRDHEAWLTQVLGKMGTIKPGMTRWDVLHVFRAEEGAPRLFTTVGGPPTGLRRETFVSQDCPYFKIDVEFKPEAVSNRDVIVKVSKPYVQFATTN